MSFQRTIRREIVLSGVGVHTGKLINLRLIPAPRDTGIVFHRVDRGVSVRAKLSFVVDTSFATTLGVDGVRIRTVEHLMASIFALGVTNLIVEIDGPEIPILDGSALPFAQAILDAGLARQGKSKPTLRITKPIYYEESRSRVVAKPYRGFRVTYKIFYEHPLILEQSLTIDVNQQTFLSEIAPARTFGFLRDIEYLLRNGYAKGGSLDNAVVLDESKIINGSLRFRDEFVRHKIVDAIGDLALLGYPLQGHFIFERGGHSSHINFLRFLLERGSFVVEEEPYFGLNLSTQTA